jgi:hypothetical protein
LAIRTRDLFIRQQTASSIQSARILPSSGSSRRLGAVVADANDTRLPEIARVAALGSQLLALGMALGWLTLAGHVKLEALQLELEPVHVDQCNG